MGTPVAASAPIMAMPMASAVDESIEARIREAEQRTRQAESAMRLQEAEMRARAAEQALAQQTRMAALEYEAVANQIMDRDGQPANRSAGPLRLSLGSPRSGQSIRLEPDCCMPFPPPVFFCCCAGLMLGSEHEAATVQYDPDSGYLRRPEVCNQRVHVSWGNYSPGVDVLSFHCGIFDCPDNEQWQPYTDGTLRPRHHTHLALGVRDEDSHTILVSADDTRRRLIFRELERGYQ